MPIKLNVLPDGDLEISVGDREIFEDILSYEFKDERHYLLELMDCAGYIGNDWDCPYNIGLTEAPAIGQGIIYPEEDDDFDGIADDWENLWYFPDYMLSSYLEILKEEGKIIFTGHRDNLCKK
jgi:hypothetical protein